MLNSILMGRPRSQAHWCGVQQTRECDESSKHDSRSRRCVARRCVSSLANFDEKPSVTQKRIDDRRMPACMLVNPDLRFRDVSIFANDDHVVVDVITTILGSERCAAHQQTPAPRPCLQRPPRRPPRSACAHLVADRGQISPARRPTTSSDYESARRAPCSPDRSCAI